MISIHWEAAGVPLTAMAKATGRFTGLVAKALARNGSGTAWLWTHENGERKGGHCHLLAHVPAELVERLTFLQRGWLRRITGRPYRARVIHSKPIGGRLGLERGNPELHAINLEAAMAYVLKGAGRIAFGAAVTSIAGGSDYEFLWYGSGNVTSAAFLNITPLASAVPEPTTWAMFLIGFGGIGYSMRRKLRFQSAKPESNPRGHASCAADQKACADILA